MRVLVWTQSEDLHADIVICELQAIGAQVDRVNGDTLPSGGVASVALPSGHVRINGQLLQSGERHYDSVWYRRRAVPTFSDLMDSSAHAFALQEANAWLDGMLLQAHDAFWVNDFASAHLARSKPYQLALARRCGLQVPATLIGNDHEAILEFALRHQKIIYKPVHHGVLPVAGEPDSLVFSTALSVGDLVGAKAEVELVPGIYQAYVPKRLELRITIVGNDVFACAIHSQEHERTSVDWRHYHAELRHTVYDLPCDIVARLHDLMRMLGLRFGTVDMILTPEGEYVFLEVNQMGQWLWVQQQTRMPISHSLVSLLTSSRKGGTSHECTAQTAGVSVQDSREPSGAKPSILDAVSVGDG